MSVEMHRKDTAAQAEERRLQAWKMKLSGMDASGVEDALGVSRATVYRYWAQMHRRMSEARHEEAKVALDDAVTDLERMRAHALDEYFLAGSAKDASRWAGIVSDCIKQRSKWEGWDAPVKTQETGAWTPLTDRELVELRDALRSPDLAPDDRERLKEDIRSGEQKRMLKALSELGVRG